MRQNIRDFAGADVHCNTLEVDRNATFNGDVTINGQLVIANAITKHNVTFQLNDGLLYVDGTQFTVQIKAEKIGAHVTLYFPAIGFEVGQSAEGDIQGVPIIGWIRSVAGALPLELSPSQLNYQTAIAASNNGYSNPFSNSNTLLVGNMDPSVFSGYISPTTFNGYINPAGYYLIVDNSSIAGPGLYIGSSLFGQGQDDLVYQGATIVSIDPLGTGNSYGLNGAYGPVGAPPDTYVPFMTQSILVIESITSGSPPVNGATLVGPGITLDTTIYQPVFNETNPDGTGLYFVNTLTTSVTANVPLPYSTIPVLSTAGFPSSGTLLVGEDVVTYTGTTATSFTGTSGSKTNLSIGESVQYSLSAGSEGTPITITADQNTVLNITQFIGGNPLRPGMIVSGTGVVPGTTIIAFSSGTGLLGTYIVSPPQTFSSTNLEVSQVIGSGVTDPAPASGYQVAVGPLGDIMISGVGQFFNYLRGGTNNLKPFSMTYLVEKPVYIPQNIALSPCCTNIANFPGGFYGASGSALRDVHVSAAYGGKVVFTWSDNSAQADQTNGVTDVYVAIGNVVNGRLVMQPPFALTHNVPNPPDNTNYIFNTAAVINPTNPNNIVVSWGLGNVPTYPYRAVSFDGGLTWPYNGPTNIQPAGTGAAGDNRGVLVDMYGNIWYGTTNLSPPYFAFDQPEWWISPDGGVTFYVAYTAPGTPWPEDAYDTPQATFAYDGFGNYGLYFCIDYFASYGQSNSLFSDILPEVGFVPITGKMSAATTANFTGSISGNTLTVTSVTSGTIMVGQQLNGDNADPANYFDPTTRIVSFLTGTGGVGTYTVNYPAAIGATNIYASFPPIGPLPLTGNTATVTAPATFPSGTIQVNSTAGFSTIGTLLLPNGSTVVYNGMTPTSFTGVTFGQGSLSVGDVLVEPSTPSFLFQFSNQTDGPSLAAAKDGRVWMAGQPAFIGTGMGPAVKYKSPATNSAFQDVVAANWSGNWIVAEVYGYYPIFRSDGMSGENAYPTFGFFNDDRVITWDETRQALYVVTEFGPLANLQDMRIAFVISRDSGQSWSDAIYVSNSFNGNRGQVNMTLDPITGDLIFSWYDGRTGGSNYENIQYYGGIMPAKCLDKIVYDLPMSNPVYQSPNATVPGNYPVNQVVSNTPRFQKRNQKINRRMQKLKR